MGRTKPAQIQQQLVGSEVSPSFRNPSLQRQVGRLFSEIDGDAVRQGTLDGPTETQKARLAALEAKAESILGRSEQLIQISVPKLNQRIEAAKLPWIRIE